MRGCIWHICSFGSDLFTSILKECSNGKFHFVILPFSKFYSSDGSRCVYQIFSRPILIVVVIPSRKVIVLSNRIMDVIHLYCLLYIGSLMFKLKFRGVNTNNDKPIFVVGIIPGGDMREGANTIDTGIGPKVYQDDFTFEVFERKWLVGVEPLGNAHKIGCRCIRVK